MFKTVEKVLMRLLDSVPLLLLLVGVAMFVVGAAGGVTYNKWFPVADGLGRLALILGGGVVFAIGIRMSLRHSQSPPDPKQFGIAITEPKNGDRVDVVAVRGTIERLPPEGYTLHAFRIYPDEKFVSMREAKIDIEKHTWEALNCDIGGRPGDPRSIVAYLVGPAGSALLEFFSDAARIHNQYAKTIESLGKSFDWLPPIKTRTPDMVECGTRVSVTRKMA